MPVPKCVSNLVTMFCAYVPTWTILKGWSTFAWVRSSYLWIVVVPIAAKFVSLLTSPISLPLSDEYKLTLPVELPFSWKFFYVAALSFAVARFIYSICCPKLIKDYDSLSDYQADGRGGAYLLEELNLPILVNAFKLGGGVVTGKQPAIDYLRYYLINFTEGNCYYDKATGKTLDFERVYGKKEELVGQHIGGSTEKPFTRSFILKAREYTGATLAERRAAQIHRAGEGDPSQKISTQEPPVWLTVKSNKLGEAYWSSKDTQDHKGPIWRSTCCVLYVLGFLLFGIVTLQSLGYVISVFGNPWEQLWH